MALEPVSVETATSCSGSAMVAGYLLGAAIISIPFAIGLINHWDFATTAAGCNPALGGIYGAIGAAFIDFVIKKVKDRNIQGQISHIPKQKEFEKNL